MHKSPFGMVRHEDLRSLSFPNNSFDLVLSAEVFEHIPEPYKALNEVFRVLKPGGSYVRLDSAYEYGPSIKGHAALDVERSWSAV